MGGIIIHVGDGRGFHVRGISHIHGCVFHLRRMHIHLMKGCGFSRRGMAEECVDFVVLHTRDLNLPVLG